MYYASVQLQLQQYISDVKDNSICWQTWVKSALYVVDLEMSDNCYLIKCP